MSNCPICDNRIESLVAWSSVKIRDFYSYDRNEGHIHVQRIFDNTSEVLKFRCPRCAEVIFYSVEKVEEFLRDD